MPTSFGSTSSILDRQSYVRNRNHPVRSRSGNRVNIKSGLNGQRLRLVANRHRIPPSLHAPDQRCVPIHQMFAQPQREVIFENEEGKRICYGLSPKPLGSMASHRCHVIEALPESRTRYHSQFRLEGWLAPVTRALFGSRLERGFAAMTQAIGQRAELLREEREEPE